MSIALVCTLSDFRDAPLCVCALVHKNFAVPALYVRLSLAGVCIRTCCPILCCQVSECACLLHRYKFGGGCCLCALVYCRGRSMTIRSCGWLGGGHQRKPHSARLLLTRKSKPFGLSFRETFESINRDYHHLAAAGFATDCTFARPLSVPALLSSYKGAAELPTSLPFRPSHRLPRT